MYIGSTVEMKEDKFSPEDKINSLLIYGFTHLYVKHKE